MQIKNLFYIIAILYATSTLSQDVYQTQYFNNPMIINPAYTGVMDDQYRVGLNYRSQWFNPLGNQGYKTGVINGELKTHITNGDFYGLGMIIGSDQMGTSNFRQTFVYGTASYIKQISSNRKSDTYLIAGLKFGGIQYSFDEGRLWFGNQFDINQVNLNTNRPTGEPNQILGNNNSGLTPDVGIGISGYQSSTLISYYGGLSVDHVTRPKISIGDGTDNLPMKWGANAGASIKIGKQSQVMPSILWVNQSPHNMLLPSIQFRFTNEDDNDIAFRAGLLSKFVSDVAGNAIESWSILTMLEYHQYILGLSYEFTTSGLGGYNNNNAAFELSMNYRWATVAKRQSINCPDF